MYNKRSAASLQNQASKYASRHNFQRSSVKAFVDKLRKSFLYRIDGAMSTSGGRDRMQADVYVQKTAAEANVLCSGLNGFGMTKAGDAVDVYEVLGSIFPVTWCLQPYQAINVLMASCGRIIKIVIQRSRARHPNTIPILQKE